VPITFLNVALLTGLFAVVIPPLIHLLNRRRFTVVRWGAMQFLEVSQRTRRRVFLEEVLLMAVRVALIALLVVGLAAPVDASRWLDFLADRGTRDVVLVVDGSASMGYRGPTGTGHDAAKAWVMAFLDDLGPTDGVAVIHARHRPIAVVAEPTHVFDAVRTAVQTLRPPRGGCDGPAAVRAAVQALSKSAAARREVVVLTDGQRQGWAHDALVPGWDALGRAGGDESPRVWMVNLDPNRPPDPPNRSVAPLRASRAIASVGQHVSFQTAIVRHGAGNPPPVGRPRLLVDGQAVGDLPPPTGPGEKGRSPMTVRHRFASAGSHVVTVQAQPDALAADDRADFALEVLPQLPVLLVDGDPDPAATRRGADFLRDALSPARDPQPAIRVRVAPIGEFEPASLTRDLAGPGTAPRVVVLCNVARLTPEQDAAVGAFLESGGGVLVAPGDRVDAGHYTRDLHRGGRGWLPAAVGEAFDNQANAAQPQVTSFFHPALELFRDPQPGGLGDARFPRYWKFTMPPDGRAVSVARLTTGDALFAEAAIGTGRVLQACVPMDNSWGTNLVELPAFAPLCHELIYYLAGARSAALNLSPGQPIRYRVPQDASTVGWSVTPPDGRERSVTVSDSQIVFGETGEAGTYELRHPASNAVRYYVVQSDPAESDLVPWTDADRGRVRQLVPGVVFAENRDTIVAGIMQAPRPAELWWVCLVGVVALLTAEGLLTRRRALAAGV
jgi:hypothetical protein